MLHARSEREASCRTLSEIAKSHAFLLGAARCGGGDAIAGALQSHRSPKPRRRRANFSVFPASLPLLQTATARRRRRFEGAPRHSAPRGRPPSNGQRLPSGHQPAARPRRRRTFDRADRAEFACFAADRRVRRARGSALRPCPAKSKVTAMKPLRAKRNRHRLHELLRPGKAMCKNDHGTLLVTRLPVNGARDRCRRSASKRQGRLWRLRARTDLLQSRMPLRKRALTNGSWHCLLIVSATYAAAHARLLRAFSFAVTIEIYKRADSKLSFTLFRFLSFNERELSSIPPGSKPQNSAR